MTDYTFNPDNSSYYHYFLCGEIYRNSCYHCMFAKKNRVGDITIGDYWGVRDYSPELLLENGGKFSSDNGISCILVNTEKGKDLLRTYGNAIELADVEFGKMAIVNTQLREPAKHTALREKLFKAYQDKGYSGVERFFQKWKQQDVYVRLLKKTVKKVLPLSVVKCIKKIIGQI